LLRTGIVGILLLCFVASFAQSKKKKRKQEEQQITESRIEQSLRFEVEVGMFDMPFDIINGEDDGVMLVRNTDERDKKGNPQYQLISLDTGLQVRWRRDLFINKWWVYRGYDYMDGAFYLLFKHEKGNSRDLKILSLNLADGDTAHHTIKNLVPLQLTEFEMTPGGALLGGYFSENPVVIHYNMETDRTIVLPGIYQNKTELIQLRVEEDKEYFVVIVSEKTIDKRNTVAVKTYSFDGTLLSNEALEPDYDKGLIYGRVADLELDLNLIAGTYSGKRSTYSRGLFIASVGSQGDQKIKYINYGDLENFFNYMKAGKQQRIENKIERKKINGKNARFNYRLLVHDIIDEGDQYIMIGEAFYPKYHSSATTANASSYYVPGSHASYFAGYRYTHAVVIGFDKRGNILWDNSFEIEDVLSYSLDQFVHAEVRGNEVILLYMYDNEVRSKIIKGAEVVEGKSFDPIRLTFEDDVLKDNNSEVSGLEPWFGDTFMAYGVQSIKNMKDDGVKLNRRVFYINKINYK
jgi:hypothetical protein